MINFDDLSTLTNLLHDMEFCKTLSRKLALWHFPG